MKGTIKKSGIYFDNYPKKGSENAVTSDGIARAIEQGGGGGGGTGDYNDLDNKPKINGITLQGNKSLVSLGIASIDEITSLSSRVSDTENDVISLSSRVSDTENDISDIKSVIPSSATATNHLATINDIPSISDTVPVGCVIAYMGINPPNKYLICDGRDTTGTNEELSTHYPILYNMLGNTNILPDLRECHLEGIGATGRSVGASDPLTLGEFRDDEIQSHTHIIRAMSQVAVGNSVGTLVQSGISPSDIVSTNGSTGRFNIVTRPKTVGVNYIIKAQS